MTAPNDNNHASVDLAMDMLSDIFLRFTVTPHEGFLARVPQGMRLYVEQFLALGKIGRLQKPAALVQNCIIMARKGAMFHGDEPPGPDLLALAKLFEQHPEEAADYARGWEAEVLRKYGGAP